MGFTSGSLTSLDIRVLLIRKKTSISMSFLVEDIGGDEGDRTPDLMNAIHALSQLSYVPASISVPAGIEIRKH
jgi:hypothetical protein